MYKTIGIVTGGGDAPGLNAVIRAVVKTAVGKYGMRVVGIEDSFEGLLGQTSTRELTPTDVRGLLPRGGTILGTRNKGYFVKRDEGGGGDKRENSCREAIGNLSRLGIEALVVLGGEGTLAIAAELDRLGFPVVGVPKTIDNDLACTELTFGFVTALDIATEALDRLHTTAESHDRVMILEVMGRHAGWIALHSGIAGGADVILIPEIPFSVEAVARKVEDRERCGSQFSIIVVSEGARVLGQEIIYQEKGDVERAPRLGGIGNHLRGHLERLTGKETRCVVLGHLQRGGSPNAFDRLLATNFGACAVRALMQGEHGVMVALQASTIHTVPISEAVANIKTVQPDSQLVRTIVKHHHEWWNGGGYPDGLKETQIPLSTRIVTVADAYDAMTSDRPYRRRLSQSTAIERLRAAAGIQFDAVVVEKLVECLEAYDTEQPRSLNLKFLERLHHAT